MSPTLNAFLSSTLCSAFNKAHHLSPLSPLSHLTHLSHIGHLGLVLFFLMLAELQGQGGSEGSSRTYPRLIIIRAVRATVRASYHCYLS